MTEQVKSSPVKENSTKHVQEKVMIGLALVFFGGVIGLAFIPAPFNGFVSGLVVFLMLVAMFRIR